MTQRHSNSVAAAKQNIALWKSERRGLKLQGIPCRLLMLAQLVSAAMELGRLERNELNDD
jgi:hypothetical protein